MSTDAKQKSLAAAHRSREAVQRQWDKARNPDYVVHTPRGSWSSDTFDAYSSTNRVFSRSPPTPPQMHLGLDMPGSDRFLRRDSLDTYAIKTPRRRPSKEVEGALTFGGRSTMMAAQ